MVFSSLVFVFAFFPLCMALYAAARRTKSKNIILLIFSLVFYAWGEPVYILILIFMTLCDFLAAKAIEKSGSSGKKRAALVAACIINIGLIGVFKYTGFLLTNVHAVFGIPEVIPKIALPIGISFYTFQLLSYVADVYRGEVKAQKSFWLLLLYSSLFYQCIAGPIVRYSEVEHDILERCVCTDDVFAGISRFSAGLAKKALLANTCGTLTDSLLVSDAFAAKNFANAAAELSSRSALGLWLGVLFYMLQIYLDFSAYSDMAIGMGKMVGFRFNENFNYPYAAKSITDFWRRWHISLSTFFRDYVYIPLGGNRKGKARTYLNLFIVWLLTGLWHGASWNFVLWGLYFFVFLVIEKAGFLKVLEKIPAFFSRAYSLIIIYFGWILFKFTDFRYIPIVVKGLFGLNGNPFADFETRTVLMGNIIFLIIALIAVTPLIKKFTVFLSKAQKGTFIHGFYNIAHAVAPIALLFVSALCLVGDSYNPFLYFQF